MELKEFIADFADQFDDTEASEITADCQFHELEEWSSLIGMGILAMAKLNYGKVISGAELRECSTVEDVYNLIKNK